MMSNSVYLLQIREGRKQTLSECLKKEFRLTINLLRTTISADVYEVRTFFTTERVFNKPSIFLTQNVASKSLKLAYNFVQ